MYSWATTTITTLEVACFYRHTNSYDHFDIRNDYA